MPRRAGAAGRWRGRRGVAARAGRAGVTDIVRQKHLDGARLRRGAVPRPLAGPRRRRSPPRADRPPRYISPPMNLFSGMTDHEVVSSILEFALFNAFVVLEVVALAAFYVASRPRRGRVLTASLWHALAAVVFMMCLISTVWAAPAEKSFINSSLA